MNPTISNHFAIFRGMLSEGYDRSLIDACLAIIELSHLSEGELKLENGGTFSSENLQTLISNGVAEVLGSSRDERFTLHELIVCGERFMFSTPSDWLSGVSVPQKMTVEDTVDAAFKIWLDVIGSDELIFKRPPSLTRSRGGRASILKKAIKQKIVRDLNEVRLVCLGCRNSLYHMGYDRNGSETGHRYCDIKNLFFNRQRVEEMIARSSLQADYREQLNQILSKKEQVQRIQNGSTPTSIDPQINVEVVSEAPQDSDIKWW